MLKQSILIALLAIGAFLAYKEYQSRPRTDPDMSLPDRGCRATDDQLRNLSSSLNAALLSTKLSRLHPDASFMHTASQAMGHGRVECFDMNECRLARIEMGISETQAVSLRSLSKIVVATTVMALHERGLVDVNQRVGDTVCEGVAFSNDTPTMLLAMSSKAMDGRLNAIRSKQLAARGDSADFVGFPPLCDELSFNPAECMDKYICPIYRGNSSAFAMGAAKLKDISKAPDTTCLPLETSRRRDCLEYAGRGYCQTAPTSMKEQCYFACPASTCEKSKVFSSKHEETATTRYEYRYDEKKKRIEKKVNPFVYDNYAYTIVDAMVFKRTGRFLVDWAKELVFQPLEMVGSMRCLKTAGEALTTEESKITCLAPPMSLEEWYKGANQSWPGGQMTQAWVSNTFFATSRDLVHFIGALLRNGTTRDGKPWLKPESVDHIYTLRVIPKRPYGSCVGTQGFGMGIGYCEGKEPYYGYPYPHMSTLSRAHPEPIGTSMCTSERTFAWGSSHGSRFALLRDKAVACIGIFNTPNKGEYPTRAHYVGHNMSAILRDTFGL